MNPSDDRVESVLHHAPRPQPPPGLRERLVRDIPRTQTRGDQAAGRSPTLVPAAWWRRWWPAVAGGSLACACLAVVGVQQAEIRTLQAEVQRLKAESAEPSGPTTPGAGGGTASPHSPPVAQVPLPHGRAELDRLRTEVSELNAEATRLEAMQAENQQLRAELAARSGLTAEETTALSEARERAQRLACVNNLKQLGLAVRIWETDNGDVFPPDVLSMTDEIASPKVLVCPTDQGRQPAPDWASYSAANLSYQYVAASGSALEPQRVMWICPIHHNVTLCDGSVQQLSAERFAALVQRDGKLYVEQSPGPQGAVDPRTGMDRRMMARYGLLPPGVSPDQMDPELMKRYGLQPAPAPAANAPEEEVVEEEESP